MMSSPHSRNNGGGSRSGSGSDSKIYFTFMFHTEVRTLQIAHSLTVAALKKLVSREFSIPPHRQLLLYGWPGETEPGSDDAKLKDLGLPNKVGLYVATTDDPNDPEPNGPVAGTSRKKNRSPEIEVEIQLNIYDATNDVSYDLPVSDCKTVTEVKQFMEGITGIKPKFQEWSGWPENVHDKQMLKDLKLDKPIHSFVVMRVESGLSVIAIASNPSTSKETPSKMRNGSQNSPASSKNQEENATTPRVYTARKSFSKGGVKDFRKQIQKKRSTLGDNEATGELNQSDSDVEMLHAGNSIEENGHGNQQSSFLAEFTPSTPKKSRIETNGSSPVKSPTKLSPSTLDFPRKVTNNILKYLNPLEQLSLRRVCKVTNTWVARGQDDDGITPWEEEKWKNYTLTIDGLGLKAFETAIRMGLPITRYTFDVEGEFFYEDTFLETFLISLGLRVKDLTLRNFFMFQNNNEYKMFQSLHKLEKLTLNNLVMKNETSESGPPNPCPSTLKHLQVLKLNYEITVPQENQLIRPKSWVLTWSMLHDCQDLLYFRFPRVCESSEGQTVGIFSPLMDYIKIRGRVSIEYLDMKHFTDTNSFYITRYMELLLKCHSKDIKLKNVSAQVVQKVLDEDVFISDKQLAFCENIVSLVNYRPFAEIAPLRNLEKLTVDVVPSAEDYTTLGRSYKNIFWPKLHTIKVKDTFQEQPDGSRVRENWQGIQEDLYGLNVSGLDRTSVKYISIDSPKFPYFLSEGRLAQKFTKVTKLRISSWYKNDSMATLNKRLVAIWKKLKLVELHIEKCPKLNDHSFIGGEVDDDGDDDTERPPPVFLKLIPTLKKFTLDLDETKITDRSFIEVFSRMELKTFVLLSKKGADISEKALLRLLNGPFGEHIERFPFDTWSTSRISADRFSRLGSRFRSML